MSKRTPLRLLGYRTPLHLLGWRWFTKYWWEYLLEKPSSHAKTYCSWWTRFWCRVKGHPRGPWYINLRGYEPDMTCKNCGDDLG